MPVPGPVDILQTFLKLHMQTKGNLKGSNLHAFYQN